MLDAESVRCIYMTDEVSYGRWNLSLKELPYNPL